MINPVTADSAGAIALFVLNTRFEVQLRNESADQLLKNNIATIQNRTLCFTRTELHNTISKLFWEAIVAASAKPTTRTLFDSMRDGGKIVQIRVDILPAPDISLGAHWPWVALRVKHNGKKDRLSPLGLVSLFGLTPTEAKVAVRLARGHSSSRIAEMLGVRQSTILSHCRAIYAKTGAKKQSELVAVLMSSLARE